MKNTMLLIAILIFTSNLQAQTLDLNNRNQTTAQVETGMPAEVAIDLLGRKPDEQTLIGAACGMLDVMTWQQDGKQTKIIATDGFVSSIEISEAVTEAQ